MELLKYGCVGTFSNLLCFLGYLLLTWGGLDPKSSMGVVYAVTLVQSFLLNRAWTFRDSGPLTPTLMRYTIAYVVSLALNVLLLVMFVDLMQYSHVWVQAVLSVPLALLLYLSIRFWVFRIPT